MGETVETFIISLINAPSGEVRDYLHEIRADNQFHEQMEKNRRKFTNRSFYWWAPGVSATLGMTLYVLCRELKPSNVVETGVSSGVSTSFILNALAKNQYGVLHSIDLPQRSYSVSIDNDSGKKPGWLIPDYLKERWHLTLGASHDVLIPVLEELQIMDVFLHDSEHTYRNMMWEYQTAWRYLKIGGVLLSHNIDANNAFPSFCRNTRDQFFYFGGMGGIMKTRDQS